MDFAKRLEEQWAEETAELREIRVPELDKDGEEYSVFVKPANLMVRDKIYKYSLDNSLLAVAATIVWRALNQDGTRMYRPTDETIRRMATSTNADILGRVAGEINSDMNIDMNVEVDSAEKN